MMTTDPPEAVDVVIVTHNSTSELSDCLNHLTGGDGDRRHIVVVDSGSDDVSWVHAVAATGATVLVTENYGYGTALNIGARVGSASWLALMNPDVAVRVEQISVLRQIAAESGAAIIGPALSDEAGRVRQHSGRALTPYWARRKPVQPAALREVEMIPGALLLVLRAAFEEIGGFDEGFFLYSEEDDLVTRLRAAGHKAVVTDRIIAIHKGEASSLVPHSWRIARRLQGEFRYLRKHRSWFAAVVTVSIDLVRACRHMRLVDMGRLVAELTRDPRARLAWPPKVRAVAGALGVHGLSDV